MTGTVRENVQVWVVIALTLEDYVTLKPQSHSETTVSIVKNHKNHLKKSHWQCDHTALSFSDVPGW